MILSTFWKNHFCFCVENDLWKGSSGSGETSNLDLYLSRLEGLKYILKEKRVVYTYGFEVCDVDRNKSKITPK